MTAGPSDPGMGENRYEPASSYDVPDGTWTDPSAFKPSDRSDEWTPIDGMSRTRGFDRGSTPTIVEVGLTRGLDDRSTEPAAATDGCGGLSPEAAATAIKVVPLSAKKIPIVARRFRWPWDVSARSRADGPLSSTPHGSASHRERPRRGGEQRSAEGEESATL